MSEFSYADAPVGVRADLPAAHRRAWQRLAAPGTWWTGEERVAIAAEARNAPGCGICARRRGALSPHALEGGHDALGGLPDAAVDVIHRVVTDPGRLSRAWFEKTLASGMGDAPYVEIIGVVVTVVSIDGFCRALGVPPQALPEPEPGEPSRRRPPAARRDAAWVAMIPPGREAGPDADLYGGSRPPNVMRAMSLVPDEVRGLTELSAAHYLPMDQLMNLRAGRALDRAQIELVAGRVSALSECFY